MGIFSSVLSVIRVHLSRRSSAKPDQSHPWFRSIFPAYVEGMHPGRGIKAQDGRLISGCIPRLVRAED